MDESDWDGGHLLYELLAVVRSRMTDRQRRLFAAACCGRYLQRLPDPRSRAAIEVAVRHADAGAAAEELDLAEHAAAEAYMELRDSRLNLDSPIVWSREGELLAQAATLCVSRGIYYAEDAADCVRWALLAERGWRCEAEEEAAQCRLLRDIVGPLRLPLFPPLWQAYNDRAALQLATLIDREEKYDILPILADALEEAGCGDERILRHCRDEGGHTRGCWVVDGVLGKR